MAKAEGLPEVSEIQVSTKGFSFKEVFLAETESCTYLFDHIHHLTLVKDASSKWFYIDMGPPAGNLWWKSKESALRFLAAIRAMKYYASSRLLVDDAGAFIGFQEKARAWRALPQKPPLPEDVRRFKMAAEDAVRKKDFDKAADYYEQGLAVEPLWPDGQLNAALAYGELDLDALAVFHMKRYLELSPDAENAKKYRDQLSIWEEMPED
jgi:hypothetical protein